MTRKQYIFQHNYRSIWDDTQSILYFIVSDKGYSTLSFADVKKLIGAKRTKSYFGHQFFLNNNEVYRLVGVVKGNLTERNLRKALPELFI